MNFDYICDNCFKEGNSQTMNSMVCDCGGNMRINRGVQGITFQPFFSKELGGLISSRKEEERVLRENNLAYMSDYKSTLKKAKLFRKHKEDMNYADYAKLGLKYPKGQSVRFDEKNGEFIKQNGERVGKKVFVSIVGLLLLSTSAFARIEGIEYANIIVQGKSYDIPIGNEERKNEIYYLKKALDGDKIAREMFLGGQKEKWFFIGDETPLWLKLTGNTEEVVVPPGL